MENNLKKRKTKKNLFLIPLKFRGKPFQGLAPLSKIFNYIYQLNHLPQNHVRNYLVTVIGFPVDIQKNLHQSWSLFSFHSYPFFQYLENVCLNSADHPPQGTP